MRGKMKKGLQKIGELTTTFTENLSLMSEADRALVSDYVNILKQPKAERRQILDRYNLRKNKNYHTRIFRTLIITKFAYKGKNK